MNSITINKRFFIYLLASLFCLSFYAYPIQNFNLSITPQDRKTYELSLTREKVGRSEQVDEPWTLDVTNAATGRKALTKEMDAPAFILQTEGWEPGVYVIRALVGEESLTGKVTVR